MEKRKLRRQLKSKGASAENWKEKNKYKRLENKALKAKIERGEKINRHHFPKRLIILSILLRIKGGCSYGGILKVLKILQFCFQLNLVKLPCENTIQNWVTKTGLYKLKKEDKGLKGKEISLIIDESIRMGQEKQLLVLSVPWKKEGKTALRFEDTEVLHIQGAKSWNGEKISEVIDKLKKEHGFILKNILSDEDSKLKKASRLSEVLHIPDISHAVGTCLRRSFEKEEKYKAFTKLVASYQSKGVNQDISYLCPPKQRSKARFMNQQGIVKWASRLLNRFDELGDKAYLFFGQLTEQQSIISDLDNSLLLAKQISLPFKKEGLSKQSIEKARQIIKEEKEEKGLFGIFLRQISNYLDNYQQIVNKIGSYAIHLSSEIIESMFSKYKNKAHNNTLTGLTKLNLELPLYSMKNEDLVNLIPIALENISMNNLEDWVEKHSSDNQLVKRNKFFKKRTLNFKF